jgi:hypothetical protein
MRALRYVASEAARAHNLMELATCNDIKVTVVLLQYKRA